MRFDALGVEITKSLCPTLRLRSWFSSRLLSSGSLVLLSPSAEDEGYFECTAVNDAGEERRVIEVILQGTGLLQSEFPSG